MIKDGLGCAVRTEVRNRLVVLRGHVSARVQPLSSDNYAWIWVLPIPPRKAGIPPFHPFDDVRVPSKYRIAVIEVPKRLVDRDECFYEPDITTRFLRVVDTIDEVDDAVREAGADPDSLEAPWHNAFPL